MLNQKNHYGILGIEPEAKPDEIKQASQRSLALAKQEYDKKTNNYKKAYSLLTQKNIDAGLRQKATRLLGLDAGETDVDVIRMTTQDALKTAKIHYERATNEIKAAFAILGNEEKREAYDNQLLLQQEQAKRREKASKQAKLAKARSQRNKSHFFGTLLRWLFLIAVVAFAVHFYFNNTELVHQWLNQIGLAVE